MLSRISLRASEKSCALVSWVCAVVEVASSARRNACLIIEIPCSSGYPVRSERPLKVGTDGANLTTDPLFVFDAERIGVDRTARGRNSRGAGAIFGALAALMAVLSATINSDAVVRVMPFAALGIGAAALAVAVTVKRRAVSSGDPNSLRLALSGEDITITSAVQTTTIKWSAVRIEEHRGDFVFYLPEGQPVRVRKAAITQAQGVERLRSFLMGQVGARAKLLN